MRISEEKFQIFVTLIYKWYLLCLGTLGSINENNKTEDVIQVVKCEADKINIQDEPNSSNSAATVVSARTARKRRIAGIFQHYYPEGGWGYVILISAFLSQFLAHGMQFGFLIILPFASRRYSANPSDSGKSIIFINGGRPQYARPFDLAESPATLKKTQQ